MGTAERKNIQYRKQDEKEFNFKRHLLDVYYPAEKGEERPVLIFVHGGTWISGSKDIYSPLGKNLAAKEMVAVVINYRLGDEVDFRKMALDVASAVKWVYTNIKEYGGDRKKIFISGHSAGGHLASLISLNPEYFDTLNMDNPIKGCLLIDAFGLNVGSFIKDHGAFYLQYVEKIFTNDEAVWKTASPLNYIREKNIPFIVWVGGKTYPILTHDNELFVNELRRYGRPVSYEVIGGKSHYEMIAQMEDKNNSLYAKIVAFVKGGML